MCILVYNSWNTVIETVNPILIFLETSISWVLNRIEDRYDQGLWNLMGRNISKIVLFVSRISIDEYRRDSGEDNDEWSKERTMIAYRREDSIEDDVIRDMRYRWWGRNDISNVWLQRIIIYGWMSIRINYSLLKISNIRMMDRLKGIRIIFSYYSFLGYR